MRVFLDTNVLASAIATRGLCGELYEAVIHDHELVTCQPVLVELKRVLSGKFRLPSPLIEGFLGLLKAEARIIESRRKLPVPIKDVDDIAILSCAVAAGADVFVTGDRELLDLQRVGSLPIMSPRQLWNRLAGLEA